MDRLRVFKNCVGVSARAALLCVRVRVPLRVPLRAPLRVRVCVCVCVCARLPMRDMRLLWWIAHRQVLREEEENGDVQDIKDATRQARVPWGPLTVSPTCATGPPWTGHAWGQLLHCRTPQFGVPHLGKSSSTRLCPRRWVQRPN